MNNLKSRISTMLYSKASEYKSTIPHKYFAYTKAADALKYSDIDIENCDVSILKSIKYIGSKTSKLILEFRDKVLTSEMSREDLIQKLRYDKKFLYKYLDSNGSESIHNLGYFVTEEWIDEIFDLVLSSDKLFIAGSIRRDSGIIKDFDIISTYSYTELVEFINLNPNLSIINKGIKRVRVLLTKDNQSLEGDIRLVPIESLSSAMLYFTGPAEFNINMRRVAKTLGYKLNEYGLFKMNDSSKTQILTNSEKDIFELLNLKYLTPEERK